MCYSKSTLFSSLQLASASNHLLLGQLLPILHGQASVQRPVQLLELSYALCLDYVSDFIFGGSNGSNFLQDRPGLRVWLKHYERRHCEASFWPQELPRMTRCLKAMGIDMLPPEHYMSRKYLGDWMLDLCEKSDQAPSSEDCAKTGHLPNRPTLYEQIKEAVEVDLKGADPELQRREVASELLDHICTQQLPHTESHNQTNPTI